MSEYSFFFLGIFLGAALGIFLAVILVSAGDERQQKQCDRERELLRRSSWALERHGERHLASAIRRELSDEAAA